MRFVHSFAIFFKKTLFCKRILWYNNTVNDVMRIYRLAARAPPQPRRYCQVVIAEAERSYAVCTPLSFFRLLPQHSWSLPFDFQVAIAKEVGGARGGRKLRRLRWFPPPRTSCTFLHKRSAQTNPSVYPKKTYKLKNNRRQNYGS